MRKAAFIDRDGVINKEKDYLYKISDFEFIDGVFETLKELQKRDFLLIIITNQAGIGRGHYTEQDFYILNEWMLDEFKKKGIAIDRVYFDPYHPVHGIGQYKRESFNRKPNPGMILEAENDFSLDLENSILIGDKESDIQAGINAGITRNFIVKTGHAFNEKKVNAYAVLENINDVLLYL